MLASSVVKTAAAALAVTAGFAFAAPQAQAHVWFGGGWGPGVVVRVGPPAYRYWGPRPYFYGYRPYVYAPGAYYGPRPYYYGYRPYYYYHPHPYYVAPVIGFGLTIR